MPALCKGVAVPLVSDPAGERRKGVGSRRAAAATVCGGYERSVPSSMAPLSPPSPL